jgi:signal transduction histidine kinase
VESCVSDPKNGKPKAVTGVFRRLAERLPDGVLLVSEDGGIAFANDSALRHLGAASADVLRERWPEIRQRIGSHLSGSETQSQHIVLGPGLDGDRSREVRVDLTRVQEDDFIGYLARLRADPIDLEAQLRTATRHRAIAKFFAQLIHDMRAPLTAMQLKVDLLREALKREPEAGTGVDLERHLGALDHELGRLARGLGQLEGLRTTGAPTESFDVIDVVRSLVTLVRPHAERRRIEVRTDITGSARVASGRDLVEVALLNVLANSLEAVDTGGWVGISVRPLGAFAVCEVSDSGPGVPVLVRDRIFDADYTTKQERDAGLGLHAARESLSALGGRLTLLEGEAGEGPCFRLEIPLAAGGAQ